jgi:MFS family permease
MLYVVLAMSVLGMGESGAGYLNSAFGAGSLVGAALAAALVTRQRLAPTLVAGIVTASVSLLLLAVQPTVAGAFVVLALAGVGRMTFDVTGRILLQRAAPPAILAQVFALLESLMNVGLALGMLFVPILVEVSGAQAALFGVAALLLLVVAATARRLWAIDAAADVPHVEIRLLKSIPVFAPLPALELEGLARALRPMSADPGTVVIREGDRGDCYYAIADGELVVSEGGREVNRVRRGDGFGEIALVRDSPRTATVTAVSHAELYALDKQSFLVAVAGHAAAGGACERVVGEHLARSAAVAS